MMRYLRLLALFFVLILSACSKEEVRLTPLSVTSPDGLTVRHEFMIETADSPEKVYRGLMGRAMLEQDSGMIFDIRVIPRDMEIAFWMKDTPIALDMLFLDADGRVFYIYQNARPNDTTPIYPPARPYAVLELNAGQVKAFDIRKDDIVHHYLFDNRK